MKKNQQIRNSTAEFLIFAMQGDAEGIEVRLEDDTVWLTQQMLASLYGSSRTNVLEHIQHIYADEELEESSTCRKIRQVQKEGNRNVNRETLFYNLDIIIAVGYRVNSKRATQFRQWATAVLRDFAIRGYVLDRKRMENGKFLGQDYFEHLLAEIREIRLSERRFYQKITDIYATSMDYDAHAPETRAFYAKVQNKLHYAVHGHTAAELIMEQSVQQLDLFTDYETEEVRKQEEEAQLVKERKRQQALLSIRGKFGKNAILRGMNLEEGATTRDRNSQIGGHKA